MADDPRDPRESPKSMRRVLDDFSSGLDTLLVSQRSVMGEFQSQSKATLTSLRAIERSLSDLARAGGGSAGLDTGRGGLATLVDEQIDQVHRAQAKISEAVSRGTDRPSGGVGERHRLMDYTLDPSQPLGPQTRSKVREKVLGMTEARTRSAKRVDDTYSNWQVTPDGRAVMLQPGYSLDEMGRYRDEGGMYADPMDAIQDQMSEDEYRSGAAQAARRAIMWGTASRTASAWKAGQPIGRAMMAGLPQGALRGLGVAGAAYTVADQVWGQMQSQAGANREMDAIYGDTGGGFLDQILPGLPGMGGGHRWDRFTNSLRGRFSLLGQENYDQLWSGAAKMALRGDERDQYIDRGADIIRGTGAQADYVNQLFKTAIEAGQSLDGLAESIQSVSDVAKDAGINAGRAREIFMSNYTVSSQALFGSGQAGPMAEFATNAQTRQALPYQGISWLSGLSDVNNLAMYGATFDMSVPQVRAHASQRPMDIIGFNYELAKQWLSAWTSDQGVSPFPVAVQTYVTGRVYDPGSPGDKAGLRRYLQMQGYADEIALSYLRDAGVTNVTLETALATAGELFIEGASVPELMEGEAAQRAEEIAALGGALPTHEVERTVQVREAGKHPRYEPGMVTEFDVDALEIPIPRGGRREMSVEEQIQSMYYGGATLDHQGRVTGLPEDFERDPILGMLINDPSFDADKAMVSVLTASGQNRVMPLMQAYRLYPGQIRSGEARLMAGWSDDKLGMNILDAFAIDPSSDLIAGTDSRAGLGRALSSMSARVPKPISDFLSRTAAESVTAPGLSEGDYLESQREEAGIADDRDSSGTWELVLSPEVKRWFEYVESQNPDLNPAAPPGGQR